MGKTCLADWHETLFLDMVNKLKNLALRLPYPVLLRLHQAYLFIRDYPAYAALRRREKLPELSASDIVSRKTSDTVFILGSGGSINSISDERWEKISKHDSFGMNFWIHHKFIPHYYFFELIGDDADQVKKMRSHVALSSRREDYRDVQKVCLELQPKRLSHWKALPQHMKKNCSTIWNPFGFARDHHELRQYISWLESRGIFSNRSKARMMKCRGSLPTLVSLALSAGYRRIVLCGVDLYGKPFFSGEQFSFVAREKTNPDNTHATANRDRIMLGMKDVLVQLNSQIALPMGSEIFVESTSSLLYPSLRLFPREHY